MPWTPQEFKTRHNKKLTPSQAKKAAKIGNAILKKTGSESSAIRIANSQAKKGK